jgi:hypothetical protein
MRQAIRALGWASNVFWIILLFFTVTAVYSAFNLRPGFGQPYESTSGGTFTVSLPFHIDNGGLYDISDVNLTTLVKDDYGSSISNSSTFVRLIPHGSNVSATHRMSVSVSQITTGSLWYLLLNDSTFNVNVALKLNYARAVPFRISSNFTMPWGAPLSNLSLGTPSLTPSGAVIPINFENHSFFVLTGTMRLEIVDNHNNVVGENATALNVQSQSGYRTELDVSISGDPANIREARLYFQTSVFNYGPLVMSLV